jgi:hypothetical protein
MLGRFFGIIMLLVLAVVFITGCLSVEKKEYRFKINADGSGEGMIRFVNIVSQDDNSKDVSFKDYAELVTDYLEGTKFEDDFPNMKVISKKLVEESGMLVGEVSFTFSAADSVGFFRYSNKDCAPLMYFLKNTNQTETVMETNGKVITGVTEPPFIIWDSGAKECTFKTKLIEDTTGTRNLVGLYHNWKK